MQNIHDYSMTGAGGGGGGSTWRFSGGGGDRRMRVHQNKILNHHQSPKCPRCNSLNTKFCYYNNYNLSQPRYFCKNCRRYWTKGGVLRNVPVGGGCRKAKRSKSKQEQPPLSPPFSVDKPTAQNVEEKSSSSESSSLTASTLLGQGSIETTAFGYGGNSLNQQCIADHVKLLEGNNVHQQFGDLTAQVDPSMEFGPLDWGSDQTLFDHAYWCKSQWTLSDQDQNGLYLP